MRWAKSLRRVWAVLILRVPLFLTKAYQTRKGIRNMTAACFPVMFRPPIRPIVMVLIQVLFRKEMEESRHR